MTRPDKLSEWNNWLVGDDECAAGVTRPKRAQVQHETCFGSPFFDLFFLLFHGSWPGVCSGRGTAGLVVAIQKHCW